MRLPVTFRELKLDDVVYTPNGYHLIAVFFSRSYVLLKAKNDSLGGIQIKDQDFDEMGFTTEVT